MLVGCYIGWMLVCFGWIVWLLCVWCVFVGLVALIHNSIVKYLLVYIVLPGYYLVVYVLLYYGLLPTSYNANKGVVYVMHFMVYFVILPVGLLLFGLWISFIAFVNLQLVYFVFYLSFGYVRYFTFMLR